jgi:hypothetical protein
VIATDGSPNFLAANQAIQEFSLMLIRLLSMCIS